MSITHYLFLIEVLAFNFDSAEQIKEEIFKKTGVPDTFKPKNLTLNW
jgi:hypothetical protein